MKYKDIERMASDAVRDYMDDGWVLDCATHAGCGVHFLNRDGERIAAGIRTVYGDEKDAREAARGAGSREDFPSHQGVPRQVGSRQVRMEERQALRCRYHEGEV